MHENSLLAYKDTDKHTRYADILNAYEVKGPMTDREVATFLGYQDLNRVRPRITELIGLDFLIESGRVRDSITGKTVRLVRRAWGKEYQLRFAM